MSTDTSRIQDTDPIAIVGMSLEFPSGKASEKNLDADSFFDFLLNGGESYEKIPQERFRVDSWCGPNPGQILVDTGSFLKDIDMFDPLEFGISTKDARSMALSTRKLIEHSLLALWDSGISYRRRKIGCYMSATGFDSLSVADYDEYDAIGSFAGYPYMVANKVSYHLDLCGPSIPIDTACSSTATALHMAVQAIRSGDCEAAIIGGSQLNHRLIDFVQYSQAGVLAPDGKCKPFDSSADGFSRSEGVAVIVLKPLRQAIKDKDFIYASILGTGINSTGSAAPVYVPVSTSQEEAMRYAYSQTIRSPTEVDYIELHATGTAVGDPLEANWAGKAFKRDGRELLVGSVKGNLGHLEITSFLASLCKVCFMFQTELIPPNINLNVPNPKIRWDEYHLKVPTEITHLRRYSSRNFLVSINSSGIGGSNAHAIVESFPIPLINSKKWNSQPVLLLAGGLSSRSSEAVAESLVDLLSKSSDNPFNISAAYGRRASQMTWRSFAIVDSATPAQFTQPRLVSRNRRPLVFVLSGQGPQHLNMGRQLFKQNVTFRTSILSMDAHYVRITGHSLLETTGIFADVADPVVLPSIWPIEITLPALAMVQMAMIDLLRNVGLVPNAVIGHSAGETAMLYACGAASQAMALEIAVARGLAMAELENVGGSMAALSCSAAIAKDIITKVKVDAPSCSTSVLEIACYNAFDAVTLAGHDILLDKAIDTARNMGIVATKLRTRVPVHSSMMNACYSSYFEKVSNAFKRYPGSHFAETTIATFSTLTGGKWTHDFSPEYFWDNARSPVLFEQNLSKAMIDATYVEISPHPVLSQYLLNAGIPSDSVLCPMRRSKIEDEWTQYRCFLQTVGSLAVLGYDVDFLKLNHVSFFPRLPTSFPYPFAKKSVPYHSESSTMIQRQFEPRNGPLNFRGLKVSMSIQHDLAEHVINSQPIVPAAGFLEMALEFGSCFLWNVRFTSVLPLLNDKAISVEVINQDAYWSVKSSPPGNISSATRLHADGYMSKEPIPQSYEALNIEAIKQQCETEAGTESFYDAIKHFTQYGSSFRRVNRFFKSKTNERIALTEVKGHSDRSKHKQHYVLDPAILDACFHVMIHPSLTGCKDPNIYYLPSRVQSVILHPNIRLEACTDVVYAYATLQGWSPDEITFDLIITNPVGERICTFLAFSVARHEKVKDLKTSVESKSYDLMYQPLSIPELPPSVLEQSMDAHLETLAFKTPDLPSENAVSGIVRILEFFVNTAKKRVIRILDVAPGISLLLENLKLMEAFNTYDSKGITIQYTRCGPRSGLIQSSGAVIEDRKPFLLETNPFSSSTFDLIVASNESSLVADVNLYLSSLYTSLVPGGCLFISSTGWKCDADHPRNSIHPSDWIALLERTRYLSPSIVPTEISGHFILVTQKPPVRLCEPHPTSSEGIVFEFVLDIASLQEKIRDVRESPIRELWITADSDCGAAVGFVRAIRKEVDFDIRLVSFDRKWGCPQRLDFVQRLSTLSDLESELLIDANGDIFVPRFVRKVSIRPASLPSNHNVQRKSSQKTICIKVTQSYAASTGLGGVVGQIYTGCLNESVTVLGVTHQDVSSDMLHIEEHMIVEFTTKSDSSSYAFFALPLFLTALCLGPAYFRNPLRMRGRRVTITDGSDFLTRSIACLFAYFGSDVQIVTLKPTPDVLSLLARSDIIISSSGSQFDIQVLLSAISSNATLHVLAEHDVYGVMQQIRRDTSMVKEVLTELLGEHQSALESLLFNIPLPDISARQPRSIFRSDRSYLLIGGIGSLGLEIALWMYENGARDMILTSRSGSASLRKPENIRGLRISSYLQSLPDLKLRLEACDGSSESEMRRLVSSITTPIGGCLLLSVVLNDRLFLSHTEATFNATMDSKKGVFQAIEAVMPIESLDFLIALSSASTFGNAGQTSYASGNTAVDWMLRKYSNAFSILAPAILDTSVFTDGDQGQYEHWESWAMTGRDICHSMEDGLQRLKSDNVWLHIPDLNWTQVRRQFGPSPLYDHLISGDQDVTPESSGPTESSKLREIVLDLLDVKPEEFSDKTPLTSYGLDSLVAGRLAFSLKPFLQITQLELLSDLTFDDVYERASRGAPEIKRTTTAQFDWKSINMPGQTVVKLVEGKGIPLIFIHGGSGNILPFIPLQERFSTPLWAIQTTPETPLDTVNTVAQFYLDRIKEHLPNGPYRLGCFSGSVLIGYELAFLFESNGDQVGQFVVVDFTPTVFCPPTLTTWDTETIETGRASRDLVRELVDLMGGLTNADAESRKTRQGIWEELINAHNGLPVPKMIQDFYHFAEHGVMNPAVKLVSDLAVQAGTDLGSVVHDVDAFKELMFVWARRVKAPLQVILPENGLAARVRDHGGVESLKLTELHGKGDVTVLPVEGTGHFSVFESDKLIDFLQLGWRA